jgi:hypothetical protein
MSLASTLSPDQSQALIYSTLRSAQIPDPLAKLVTAQSGHETDGWTSDVYNSLSNAFGYGFDGSSYKDYNAIGGVEKSAQDLADYLNRRVNQSGWPALDQITTADQYAALLKSAGYYTDSLANYAAGIKRWFNDNLTVIIGATSAGLLLIGILLVYLARK